MISGVSDISCNGDFFTPVSFELSKCVLTNTFLFFYLQLFVGIELVCRTPATLLVLSFNSPGAPLLSRSAKLASHCANFSTLPSAFTVRY